MCCGAGRIWLPSAEPIAFGVPGHTTNLNGIKVLNDTEYAVELWARSFPSGMSLEVTVGEWTTQAVRPNTPLGTTEMTRYSPMQPRTRAQTLGANWTKITATVPKAERPAGATLNLLASVVESDVFAAGSVWVDDVTVVCVAGCPPPPDDSH